MIALSPASRAAQDDTPLDMLGYADWSDVLIAIDRITDEVIAEHAACPACHGVGVAGRAVGERERG